MDRRILAALPRMIEPAVSLAVFLRLAVLRVGPFFFSPLILVHSEKFADVISGSLDGWIARACRGYKSGAKRQERFPMLFRKAPNLVIAAYKSLDCVEFGKQFPTHFLACSFGYVHSIFQFSNAAHSVRQTILENLQPIDHNSAP